MGLIGGSLALGLRRAGYRGKLIGVSHPKTLGEARALNAIDEGLPYEELIKAARAADLIVLSSPIFAGVSRRASPSCNESKRRLQGIPRSRDSGYTPVGAVEGYAHRSVLRLVSFFARMDDPRWA